MQEATIFSDSLLVYHHSAGVSVLSDKLLGQVWRARSDQHAAEQYFSRSARIAEQNEDPHILAYALQQWGVVATERGAVAEGHKHLQGALEMFEMLKLKKQVQKTAALLAHYHSQQPI